MSPPTTLDPAPPRQLGLVFVHPRADNRIDHRFRRHILSRAHRRHPQSVFSRHFLGSIRRQHIYARRPLGGIHHPRADHRRSGRDRAGDEFRAGSARPRRARSHGRHLLQRRHHPADRRRCEIAGLGVFDRQRRCGRPGRADHPDRRIAGLQHRPDYRDGALAAHHAGRGRRGRRHRGDLQHTDRRRHVRDRTDDAGSQRPHVSSRGARYRHGNLRWQLVFRTTAGFCGSDPAGARPPSYVDDRARALCRARRCHGRSRGGFRARAFGRGKRSS